MNVISLTAENIKRLRAVHITPDGNVVTVGGRNAQGKTSVLDSIAMAIGGKDLVPDKPVRTGAQKGFTEVVIGDKGVPLYTVRRSMTAAGGTSLTVKSADGSPIKSPQALLDSLIGKLSFDPMEFAALARKKPTEAQELLRRIVSLDTSALDAERESVFGKRTDVNRALKAAEAQLSTAQRFDGVPVDEVTITDLVAQLADADAKHEEAAAARRRFDELAAEWKRVGTNIEGVEKEIVRLEELIAKARSEIELATAKRSEMKPKLVEAREVFNCAIAGLPDRDAIRRQMTDADAVNAKIRANKRHGELRQEAETLALQAAQLTDQLDAIAAQKAEVIASAPYPIPGLSFDAQGAILFNQEPFSQASTAEQIRVSVAIGAALNPALRVLLVRNGNDMDSTSLAALSSFAAEQEMQVWVERVAESSDGVSVLIEDGSVVGADVPAVEPPKGVQVAKREVSKQPPQLFDGVRVKNVSTTHDGFVDVAGGGRIVLKPGEERNVPRDVEAKSRYIDFVGAQT